MYLRLHAWYITIRCYDCRKRNLIRAALTMVHVRVELSISYMRTNMFVCVICVCKAYNYKLNLG